MDADLLVMLTEWNEFSTLNLERIAASMAAARLADLRSIYTRREALRAGCEVYDAV